MRKLFSGKFGRIPAAVLATVLISVLVAGGVVAATGGYTLWEGSAEITVEEAVHVYWASASEHAADPSTYPHELVLGGDDPLGASVGLYAGSCKYTYFKITSAIPDDLLIKAISSVVGAAPVTVTFDVADISTVGVVVNSASPLLVTRTVCADGGADPALDATVSTGFTRESAP